MHGSPNTRRVALQCPKLGSSAALAAELPSKEAHAALLYTEGILQTLAIHTCLNSWWHTYTHLRCVTHLR